MAIALAHSYTAADSAEATSLTVTISVAPAAGALLIAMLCYDRSVVATTPSGWAVVGTDSQDGTPWTDKAVVYSKTATGAETSVVFSYGGSDVSRSAACYMEFTGSKGVVNGFTIRGDLTADTTAVGPTLSAVPVRALSVTGGFGSGSAASSSWTTSGTNWTEAIDISSTTGIRAISVATNPTSTGTVTGATLTHSITKDATSECSFYLEAPLLDGGLLMAM